MSDSDSDTQNQRFIKDHQGSIHVYNEAIHASMIPALADFIPNPFISSTKPTTLVDPPAPAPAPVDATNIVLRPRGRPAKHASELNKDLDAS